MLLELVVGTVKCVHGMLQLLSSHLCILDSQSPKTTVYIELYSCKTPGMHDYIQGIALYITYCSVLCNADTSIHKFVAK